MPPSGNPTLARAIEVAERRAAALRQLGDVEREIGAEEVAALLGLKPAVNGRTNGEVETRDERAPLTLGVQVEDGVVGGDHPRGKAAIRQIVAEGGWGVWTLMQLREEMKRRSWFTSNKAVEVAVTRLMGAGECRRVGKGRYEFPALSRGAA